MPDSDVPVDRLHGFQNIYEFFIRLGRNGPILVAGNHPAVPKRGDLDTRRPAASTILASLGQAAFVWDIASDAMTWSDHAASVFPDIPPEALASGAEFSKADRAGALDPDRCAGPFAARRAAARARPTGSNMACAPRPPRRCCGSRNPAAGLPAPTASRRASQGIVRINNERHARDEQLAEAVAARSPDRRAQPHPSDRVAGRDHRGSDALPLHLRLHADRHRSSGAHQRRLRLRRRRRRDLGSGGSAFAPGCAAATCSAASPATSSG